MTKINPKIVKREPYCQQTCDYYNEQLSDFCKTIGKDADYCEATKTIVQIDAPCVPGLREQRDEYKLELEKVEKELQQYIIWHGELKAERDELKKKYEDLYARWGDVPDEYENYKELSAQLLGKDFDREIAYEKIKAERDELKAELDALKKRVKELENDN